MTMGANTIAATLRTLLHLPAALALAAVLTACASAPPAGGNASALIQRTTHGVAHISAPDYETLAYGVAYAHAQDNVCQTAQQLVTARGARSATFGAAGSGQLGLRVLPNEQVDFFIAAHMDDARLAAQWASASEQTRAMARGYVAGYNRYLADAADKLPAACKGQPWVQPMTLAQYYRVNEITSVQAGVAALADAMLAARPPAATSAQAQPQALPTAQQLADAAQSMREAGLLDSPYGSNAWAFGKDTTANGRGMLLGNPHFPWVGVNRFWQMHLTIPGELDVMGASIGLTALVQIGFNKDVAWSHTVSTGKRFTLHELKLVPGEPTSYVIDGRSEKMTAKKLTIQSLGADGKVSAKEHTIWLTRYGPVIVNPRAGLNWTASMAYALQDANSGNTRASDVWLSFAKAQSVQDMRAGMTKLGIPWVNTIAADRHGNAMYADVSVVPDVDAAQLQRCTPSKAAAALLGAAGLVVLDGSRSDCNWRRDTASPVPGLTPIERMAVAVRSDWVHNSNDSFFYTHPKQQWTGISPLVGDDVVRRPRTRSELIEIPELLGRGKVTLAAMQKQLLENRNLMGQMIVPDLLAACAQAPTPEAQQGCAALRGWGRTSELGDKGAVLFREFWRVASTIPNVYRQPFDKARPVQTPAGLNMAQADVATKVWDALAGAVKKIQAAGFAPDVTLGQVQRPIFTDEPVFLHGGDEIEGVLNNLGDRSAPGISVRGLRIDYGTSYVQTVTFDERGPQAQALLTYGQSTIPGSVHQTDQMKLYARKEWPTLPFHADDVVRQRVGEPLRLTRP